MGVRSHSLFQTADADSSKTDASDNQLSMTTFAWFQTADADSSKTDSNRPLFDSWN